MTTAVDDERLLDSNPTERGWYATLKCWDAEEGIFPGAHFWNGDEWQPMTFASVQHWPIKFETERDAEDFAYEHDPER